MANCLTACSVLTKARASALSRVSHLPTSLVSTTQHSQLAHHYEPEPEPHITMHTFRDDIVLHNFEKCLESFGKRDKDFVTYLKRQNFLRQQRKEWLRYNLAMRRNSEELFMCSASGNENVEKPDEHAKLYEMRDYLAEHLRTFFVKTHNYSIYHNDVIFENNYFDPPKTFKGINAYSLQLNKYRWLASFRYAHAKFEILKITANEADHSIRVRWRIAGLSNMAVFSRFYKFFPGRYRNSVTNEADWHDGYSTFYLNNDSVIVKHKVDRVMPDDELAVVDKKSGLAAKLALTLGFFLGPSVGD